jgi:hypothetical protein
MIVPVLLTHRSWVDLDKRPKNDICLQHIHLEVHKAELEWVARAVHRICQVKQASQTCVFRGSRDWAPWISIDPTSPSMAGRSFGGDLPWSFFNPRQLVATADSRPARVIAFDPATQRDRV